MTSNDENPVVEYTTPGSYDVTLIVSNAAGADTVFVTNDVNLRIRADALGLTSEAYEAGSVTNTDSYVEIWLSVHAMIRVSRFARFVRKHSSCLQVRRHMSHLE